MMMNVRSLFRPLMNMCATSEHYVHRFAPMHLRNFCKPALDECTALKESSLLTSQDKIPDSWSQPKVVVIGAGIAGLSAAHRLVQNGINDITILEATDRPGGRIQSHWFANSIAELGDSAVHGGCEANSLYSLALMTQQPIVCERSSKALFFTSDGMFVNPRVSEKAKYLFHCVQRNAFEREESSMSDNDDFTEDSYLQTYMKQHISKEVNTFPECQRSHLLMVANTYLRKLMEKTGADLNRIKIKQFASLATLDGEEIKLPDGFVGILEPLIKDIPDGAIRYCKPVESISWDVSDTTKPRASVRCDDEVFPADYVIITTPLGFLKEHAERFFVPNLPLKHMEAIKALRFGHLNHMFFQFRRPVPLGNNSSIWFAWHPEHYEQCDIWVKGLTSMSVNDDKGCVLKATIAGKEATMIETLDEQQIMCDLQNHLHRFIENYSIPKPSNILMSKWSSNQFTRGAFTYLGLDSNLGHIRDLAQPVPQPCETEAPPVLLFAGEHTCPEHYATSHGARVSGIREADTIIDYTKRLKGAPGKQSAPPTTGNDGETFTGISDV